VLERPLPDWSISLGAVYWVTPQEGPLPKRLKVFGCQFELAQPFLEVIKERPRLMLMLKADDSVVRVADDDHVAGRLA
jgi:hypothetical protein